MNEIKKNCNNAPIDMSVYDMSGSRNFYMTFLMIFFIYNTPALTYLYEEYIF